MTDRNPVAPLRAIVERGAGTDRLECGHIVDHRRRGTKTARCEMCLSLEDRRQLIDRRLKLAAARRGRRG